MHVSEPELASLEAEGQPLVIDPEQMQDRRLEIVHVHRILHDIEREVVGLAVAESGLHPAARHPEGEGVGMMIAAPALGVVDVALEKRGAAEFTAPDDEGVVEQTAPLEVLD